MVAKICKLISKTGEFELKGEGGPAEFYRFTREELKDLPMPAFYRDVLEIVFSA
ncbi:MAG: hypothetical protein HY482_00825 [Candidatus Wildermuthbacteria bacterium]|nr:hypothetical protein [Candidatus Wildermuthbacteria bacterium]